MKGEELYARGLGSYCQSSEGAWLCEYQLWGWSVPAVSYQDSPGVFYEGALNSVEMMLKTNRMKKPVASHSLSP